MSDLRLRDLFLHAVRPQTAMIYAALAEPVVAGRVSPDDLLARLPASRLIQALAALRLYVRLTGQGPLPSAAAEREARRRAATARLCARQATPSAAEVAFAEQALSGRPLAVFMLCRYAGLRVRSALALLWKDVDFERAVLVVAHAKGGRPYTVPLVEPLLSFLKERRARLYDPVCGGIDESHVRRRFRPFGLTPHGLRRFFATELLARGVPAAIVSRLLNHSNPEITQRYCQPELETLRSFMRKEVP